MAVENASPAVTGTAALAQDIEALVRYAIGHGMFAPEDGMWAYNAVLESVGATGPAASGASDLLSWAYLVSPTRGLPTPDEPTSLFVSNDEFDLEGTIERIAAAGIANGCDEDTPSGADRIATRVMGLIMPRPSEVERAFAEQYELDGAEAATDWFYQLCCDARYVRTAAIAKNIGWTTPTPWGELEITINLSKPEKDPKAIAAAGAAPVGEAYPACQLCMENEGYGGRGAGAAFGAHPARQNLRIVPITLGGEHWGFQYSPYAYFSEHCIAMSAEHRLMHVDRENMARLVDFVDLFPHYFVGSNADLPIVGGSILSHDHFQGGRHTFPMMKAAVEETFEIPGFASVRAEVLRWPLSVLRLTAAGREELLDAAAHVLDVWRGWSDEELGIIAETVEDGEPVRHNTITPIACREADGSYTLYLALRCNIATDEHPLGVFHPHAEWHHIKKENIGLIEVMGLAILPPRLVEELGAVREHLLAGDDVAALEADPLTASHAAWAAELAAAHPELSADNAGEIIRAGVGEVFGHVLEDAGVYKWDDAGRAGLHRFLAAL
ncbi:UDP-glucose--hexose-1-phosphate uridylyltransferase [uncultured Enorma sp.]|uniref:UDP-glucose--hexose-1-phosphate uridylyltransferase n=1 Tax=uncultured Enorma sp. TaxID=1714346 RepID=UPI00265E5A02|nr:UDP-glucose--hexose-1-phosphate uridylyltransferase [uncultured Enorma sp.]